MTMARYVDNDTRYDFEGAIKDDNERLRERIKELEAQGRSDRHVAMDASVKELEAQGRVAALEEQLVTARNDALDEAARVVRSILRDDTSSLKYPLDVLQDRLEYLEQLPAEILALKEPAND